MTSQTLNPANNNYSCFRTNIDYFSIACKAARRWGKRIADASPARNTRELKSAILIVGCAPGRVFQQAFTRKKSRGKERGKEARQRAILHRASKQDKLTGNARHAIESLGVLKSSCHHASRGRRRLRCSGIWSFSWCYSYSRLPAAADQGRIQYRSRVPILWSTSLRHGQKNTWSTIPAIL